MAKVKKSAKQADRKFIADAVDAINWEKVNIFLLSIERRMSKLEKNPASKRKVKKHLAKMGRKVMELRKSLGL